MEDFRRGSGPPVLRRYTRRCYGHDLARWVDVGDLTLHATGADRAEPVIERHRTGVR